VLPSAELAYDACLSAGSIAKRSPHPELHQAGLLTEQIHRSQCFGGFEKWSARDDLHVQGCLILSQVGLLFPVNHAPMKMASLTGFAPVISCMRGRHVGWTTPQGQKSELASLAPRCSGLGFPNAAYD